MCVPPVVQMYPYFVQRNYSYFFQCNSMLTSCGTNLYLLLKVQLHLYSCSTVVSVLVPLWVYPYFLQYNCILISSSTDVCLLLTAQLHPYFLQYKCIVPSYNTTVCLLLTVQLCPYFLQYNYMLFFLQYEYMYILTSYNTTIFASSSKIICLLFFGTTVCLLPAVQFYPDLLQNICACLLFSCFLQCSYVLFPYIKKHISIKLGSKSLLSPIHVTCGLR